MVIKATHWILRVLTLFCVLTVVFMNLHSGENCVELNTCTNTNEDIQNRELLNKQMDRTSIAVLLVIFCHSVCRMIQWGN